MAESPRRFSLSLWNIAKIILALLLVWFVLSKTDLAQLFALRERISLPWLVTAILSYFLLTFLKALQYYFLIDRRVDYLQVVNIVVVQNAISNFIATSVGIASYLALFRVEQGVKIGRVALAFMLAKVGDLTSIWMFMVVSSFLIWPQVTSFHNLIIILLVAIGSAILIFFIFLLLRHDVFVLLSRFVYVLKLSQLGFVKKLMDFLSSLVEQEKGFIFRMVGVGIGFSLVYMSVTMIWLYANLQTFSLTIDILSVVFVNVFMQLISYFPIQIFGGLGVNETTSLYLYSIFNFPQTELATVLVGTRLLFYLTNLAVLLYLPVHALTFRPKNTKK